MPTQQKMFGNKEIGEENNSGERCTPVESSWSGGGAVYDRAQMEGHDNQGNVYIDTDARFRKFPSGDTQKRGNFDW